MSDEVREYILNEFHNAVRYTLEHWNKFSEEDYNRVMEELQKEVDNAKNTTSRLHRTDQ